MNKHKALLLGLAIVALIAAWYAQAVCADGGGMAARYRACSCLGYEWLLYDQTAADGPRRSLCLGLVGRRTCYQFQGGPEVPCAPD
jgi:hypothetical protein